VCKCSVSRQCVLPPKPVLSAYSTKRRRHRSSSSSGSGSHGPVSKQGSKDEKHIEKRQRKKGGKKKRKVNICDDTACPARFVQLVKHCLYVCVAWQPMSPVETYEIPNFSKAGNFLMHGSLFRYLFEFLKICLAVMPPAWRCTLCNLRLLQSKRKLLTESMRNQTQSIPEEDEEEESEEEESGEEQDDDDTVG